MYRTLFVLFSLLTISYCSPQISPNGTIVVLKQRTFQTRIINGNTAKQNVYPYQVAILHNTTGVYCSGSLISKTMVLTTASCLQDYTVKVTKVLFGYNKIISTTSDDQQIIDSKNIFIHPDFSQTLLQNDIAIVEVQNKVTLNNIVKTIKLDQSTYDHTRQIGLVTGWGSTTSPDGDNVSDLRYLENPIMNNDDCRGISEQYDKIIKKMHICLANDDNQGICGIGDSGSPLVVEGIQVGIGSFGPNSCSGFPSGFTRISEFQSWIKKICADCQFGKTSNNNSNDIKISWYLFAAVLFVMNLRAIN